MHILLRTLCGTAVFCLLSAPLSQQALAKDSSDRGSGRGMAIPELMFYEAAEQAVEDGYAVIIPGSGKDAKAVTEDKKTEESQPAAVVKAGDTGDPAPVEK